MKLTNLFIMQKELDQYIEDKHPRKQGEDRLDKKVLALLVELGECLNEQRKCFKYWKKDNSPVTRKARNPYMDVEGVEFYNPLLEEYIDCFHFLLSIGLELRYTPSYVGTYKYHSVGRQFKELFWEVTNIEDNLTETDYTCIFAKLIGLGEMFGFTEVRIMQAYKEKHEINIKRQDNSY